MTVPMPPAAAVPVADRFCRVAVIHEWLTIPGGSEKVVCAISGYCPGRGVHVDL